MRSFWNLIYFHPRIWGQSINRNYLLDGVRGWAALVVLVVHVFIGMLPPIDDPGQYIRDWWPFTGRFAVCLFFVVSGSALSTGFMTSGKRQTLTRILAGRYFRLIIPIFVACGIMSLFLNVGLILEPDSRPAKYLNFFSFDPSLGHLLKFGLFDVLFSYTREASYAPPLWTMQIELIGSILVCTALMVFGRPRNWILIFVVLSVICCLYFSYYFLFLFGVLMADFQKQIEAKQNEPLGFFLMMAGCAITVITRGEPAFLAIGCSVFFVGISLSKLAIGFFSAPFSRWLGKISFGLYLIHFPIIFAVGMPIYVVYQESILGKVAAGLVAGAASIIAARLLVPVDVVAMRVSRWIGSRVVSVFAKIATVVKAL